MKRQQKQLILLIAMLVLLAGGYFGIRQYNKAQANKTSLDTNIPMTTVSGEDIVKISYDYEGVTYSMEKDGDTWYDASDRSRKLTQYSITAMASNLAGLKATQQIENVTDLNQYGLTEGYRTISFETASESYTFYLGDQNAITEEYYLCKPSESTVYTVGATLANRFNYTLEDLTEEEEETTEGATS